MLSAETVNQNQKQTEGNLETEALKEQIQTTPTKKRKKERKIRNKSIQSLVDFKIKPETVFKK